MEERSDFEPDEPVKIPITEEIDLHTFRPAETKQVLEAYFEACRAKGLRKVRVIHGKGTGTLREKVRSALRSSPHVTSYHNADEQSGGWGATWVELRAAGARPEQGQRIHETDT
jgi:DNA-nicking Smr family endonuclease